MTKEEKLKVLKTHPLYTQEWDSDYYKDMSNAFKSAVNSYEAWDDVKKEISDLPIGFSVFDCLCIINKYLKEMEEQ